LVSSYDQLSEIVKLASFPLPERPDGIVTVIRYSSIYDADCQLSESSYDLLARQHPATLFLRCYAEATSLDSDSGSDQQAEGALLHARAQVLSLPTCDVFYQKLRVARLEGVSACMGSSSTSANVPITLEQILERYEFQNSSLDLFSDDGISAQKGIGMKWGDGTIARDAAMKTPRTTARFVPGEFSCNNLCRRMCNE
jgi:hypothetical protein